MSRQVVSLLLAADAGGVCQRLLLSGDVDVTTGLSTTYSLHLAARNGHAAVVRFVTSLFDGT